LPKPRELRIDITLNIGPNGILAIRKLQKMAEVNWQTLDDLGEYRKLFKKILVDEPCVD
jgi:hypothetical protein